MMAESVRRRRPLSLLDCLTDSLECGICSEQKELRLLPCQHMICIDCLHSMWETNSELGKNLECAFCRKKLDKEPTEYPICRLAVEFQQQIYQLQSAMKRRSTYRDSSTKRPLTRQPNFERSIDEEDAAANDGKSDTLEDDESVHSEDDETGSESSNEEECQNVGCTNRSLSWVCMQCHKFLCNGCRSVPCQTENTNGTHKLSHIEDAVEESIEYFESVKKSLRARIFNAKIEKKILVSEINSLTKKLVQGSLEQDMFSETADQLQEKSVAVVAAGKEEKADMEMLQTLEQFVKESSDAEYVMVAQWVAEERASDGPVDMIKFDMSLQTCEQVSYTPCHGITQYKEGSAMVGTPGNLTLVKSHHCEMIAIDCKFDYGKYTSMDYYKNRLYCLRNNKTDGSRQLSVRNANYREICKWGVSNWTALGGVAVAAEKVYVSNRADIDVYTTKGVFIKKLKLNLRSSADFVSYGNDKLAICDMQASQVIVLQHDGTRLWASNVSFPQAICKDSFGNLWVWSKGQRNLTVLSDEGKRKQTLTHAILSSFQRSDDVTSMCISGSFLWMTSLQKGLFRIGIDIRREIKDCSSPELSERPPPRPPKTSLSR